MHFFHSTGSNAQLDKIDANTTAIGRQVAFLVPLVCNLTIEANNLWTHTQIADSTSERKDRFRAKLVAHLGYSKKCVLYKCMASAVEGDNEEIQAAHIAPAKSKIKLLASIGLTQDDVNSVKNGLMLAFGIHNEFDNLRISFVKSNPLSETLYMKIWDDTCRNTLLFEGSQRTVGEFDGAMLNLGTHQPFKRALSCQAYMAFLKFKHIPANLEAVEYGSENESSYFKERQIMKEAVIRDIRYEIEEEE